MNSLIQDTSKELTKGNTMNNVEVIDITNISDNRISLAKLLKLSFEKANHMSAFDMLCMLCEQSSKLGFVIEHNLSNETIQEIEKEISLKAKKEVVLANPLAEELPKQTTKEETDEAIIRQLKQMINI